MYQHLVEHILVQACRHPTYGVNAMIDAMVTNSLIIVGDDPPPKFEAESLTCETKDPSVADGEFPDFAQVLAFEQVDETQIPAELFLSTAERSVDLFPIMCRYKTNKSDQAEAKRDWFYVAQAFGSTLRQLMKEVNANERTACGVRLIALKQMVTTKPYATVGGTKVTGGFGILWELRDISPLLA